MPGRTLSGSEQVLQQLQELRKIDIGSETAAIDASTGILKYLDSVSSALESKKFTREAEALRDAIVHSTTSTDFGGLGLTADQSLTGKDESEVLFLVSAYLEALNSQDRYETAVPPLDSRPPGRRGMTVTEKIFAAHDVERKGEVKPGDVIRVDVDWVIASDISWGGMEVTYEELGKPGIWRNDRLWIAGDHVVEPRIMDTPKVKPLIEASERARQVFKMTEHQGNNYTIMHTEFMRERSQPGMIVIGSDSHTCSAGSVSCLAVGMGAADVTMPLVLGQTWFKVPETAEIRFVGEPKPGLSGKDVILYVLQQLKRNTVAADKVVEYTGPGLKHLSCDARFAIANMTTEFGGVTGIFAPDEITQEFINKRKNPKYKKYATYYKPDSDAVYASSHTIDLSQVESFIARYPSPDDVVPAREIAGKKLDGCFIGACTTAREDLILAAMVLEVGLKKGLKPVSRGKRRVTPGSRPILKELKDRGLAQIYEDAGFTVGVPGCSYCVGISADVGQEGEVWLSSQNRNFKNRMGRGAIGSIASAVTVAASSFGMEITDPKPLLDEVDIARLESILGRKPSGATEVKYVEPGTAAKEPGSERGEKFQATLPTSVTADTSSSENNVVKGKVITLGDFVDTDAIIPAQALVNARMSFKEQGTWCMSYVYPEFRSKVASGMNVVVAGKAFGCGSSRESAVTALQGCGVKAVIAKSYSFIYGRNQPNFGLLGVIINDDEFYRTAEEGVDIELDIQKGEIKCGGKTFPFQLSELEKKLIQCGGVSEAFRLWGKGYMEMITTGKIPSSEDKQEDSGLKW
ncbi:aconitase family protein [Rhizodiscina lignyota]|uniref:Aconitase family protein n=1 Tax=Rhizodiscina lignyota TaxID=1504668 RepID=A0A9P4M5M1_9PEZI|nr:aconitase family protein [Rhizodiscina lignyota]